MPEFTNFKTAFLPRFPNFENLRAAAAQKILPKTPLFNPLLDIIFQKSYPEVKNLDLFWIEP